MSFRQNWKNFKMVWRFKKYLGFLLNSTNQHGIHSPFVYHLVTKCFYGKTDRAAVQFLKKERRRIRVNNPLKKAKLMFRILNYFSVENALVFAEKPSLSISVIEKQELQKCFLFSLSENDKNPEFFTQKPKPLDQFDRQKKEPFPADLVFVDTSISAETIPKIFENVSPSLTKNSVLIIDGIHKNEAIEKKWGTLKNHPKTCQSIDLFFWGMLFFRTEQAREDFKVRV